MKLQIRKGVFETNSSSVHSICISKDEPNIPRGITLHFRLGEYDWDFEEVDSNGDYLYTAICRLAQWDENKDTMLEKLAGTLKKYDIECVFQPETEVEYWSFDHVLEARDFIECMLSNEDLLLKYLFSPKSTIYTGNDNADIDYTETMAYSASEEVYDDLKGLIKNPRHDSEQFTYFLKEN